MKYSKILLCMTVLVCLAFQACAQSDPLGESSASSTMGSSGDYLSPNMGQMYRGTSDPGLAGMLQWLDTPVPNFPWYTTGGSFYSQPYSDITFSPLHTVLCTLRYACSGRNNKQSYQVRYNAENTFRCVLRCRCRVAVHPVCSHSAIQDQ